MNLFASFKTRRADLLGLASSMLCLVHCLAFPLLYAAFSAYDSHAHAHTHGHGHDHAHGHTHAHGGFNIDYLFASLALVAVVMAIRQTNLWPVRLGLGLGWAVLATGIVLAGQGFPDYVIHLGSLILVAAHIYNFRKGHTHCAVAH